MKPIKVEIEDTSFVVVRASTGTYVQGGGFLGLTKDISKAQLFSTQAKALEWAEQVKINMDKRWAKRGGGNHPYTGLVVRLLQTTTTYLIS